MPSDSQDTAVPSTSTAFAPVAVAGLVGPTVSAGNVTQHRPRRDPVGAPVGQPRSARTASMELLRRSQIRPTSGTVTGAASTLRRVTIAPEPVKTETKKDGDRPQKSLGKKKVTYKSAGSLLALLPKDRQGIPAVAARAQRLAAPESTYVFDNHQNLIDFLLNGTRGLYHYFAAEDPSKSPPHYSWPADDQQTYLASTILVPQTMRAPQSPARDDGSNRPPVDIEMKSVHDSMNDNLSKQRDRPFKATNIKKTATTNVFRARITITFRTSAATKYAEGWKYGPETNHSVEGNTDIYQSSGVLLAKSDERKSAKRHLTKESDVEGKVRGAIAQASTLTKSANKRKFSELSIAPRPAGKEAKKVNYSQTADTNAGKYVVNKDQIASSCFHSEVQALAMAGNEIPALVLDLIRRMLDTQISEEPPTKRSRFATPAPATPLSTPLAGGDETMADDIQSAVSVVLESGTSFVVTSLLVHGASVPNTVCGGACKPALSLLLKFIDETFVAEYHSRKAKFDAKGIFVRRSAAFETRMSVAGLKEFGTYGKGSWPTNEPMPGHGLIIEHFPAIRKPPKEPRKKKVDDKKTKKPTPTRATSARKRASSSS
jgi:hypothetical protein